MVHPRFGAKGDADYLLDHLKYVESKEMEIINDPESNILSSNKFKGVILASTVMDVPKTMLYNPEFHDDLEKILENFTGHTFVKPVYSSMGRDITLALDQEKLKNLLTNAKSSMVVQEAVKFKRLIRVIYIDGYMRAYYELPSYGSHSQFHNYYAKVCMNSNSRPFKIDDELKKHAELLADKFKAKLMVADIFQTENGYIFNEINTACNLNYYNEIEGINFAAKMAEFFLKNN